LNVFIALHVTAQVTIQGSPSLAALSLSATSFVIGDAASTVIGAIQGKTGGSSLSLADDHAGAVAIAGGNLVVGASAPGSAGNFSVTIRETLAGAGNSPRDTVLSIEITATAPTYTDDDYAAFAAAA
jgi:hypothetical protein